MSSFVVQDLDRENPTGRLDVRQFDPALWKTTAEIRFAGRPGSQLRLCTIGDIVDSPTGITSGATPLGAVYVESGVPFLRVQNVRRGYLALDDVVYIDPSTHDDMRRSQLNAGDVLLTITGSYGQSAKVPDSLPPANINQHVARLRLTGETGPDFLVGYLNSRLGRDQLTRAYTGSTRPALDYEAIRRTELLLPSPKAAGVIAHHVRQGLAAAGRTERDGRDLIATEGRVVSDILGVPVLPRLKGRCFQVDPARLTGRLDAVRQDPDYEFVLSRLRRGKYPLVEVSTVARNTTKPIRPSDNPARPFIPVDLEDIDPTYGQIVPPEPRLGIDFGPDTRVRLLPGDLAVNRLRFYLRKVAVVPQTSDWVGTGELYTFGCDAPEDVTYLWCVLRQDFAVRQMNHFVTG